MKKYLVYLPTCPEGEFDQAFDTRQEAEAHAGPRCGIIVEEDVKPKVCVCCKATESDLWYEGQDEIDDPIDVACGEVPINKIPITVDICEKCWDTQNGYEAYGFGAEGSFE
jgi:hypothetical protein